MSDKSKIEWTDATWNPMTGCSPVSEGCLNCYARGQAMRLQRMGSPKYEHGFDCRFHEDVLNDPIRWQRPRRVFVNSMSDTFHPSFTFEQIAALYNVMLRAPQHTFQVLTKRPERMLEWYEWVKRFRQYVWHSGKSDPIAEVRWPLPNVYVGVTTENQKRYDERVPILMRVPAAVRFISAEPLLGRIDLRTDLVSIIGKRRAPVDWVIIGCESGPNRRPTTLEDVYSLSAQCVDCNVPLHVKQLEISGTIVKNPIAQFTGKPGDLIT